MAEANCDIGLIGLAVMGQNLVLNMNDHGYKVAVFNRTVSKVDDFLNDEAKGTQVVGAHSVEELCSLLKTPAARHDHGQGRRRGRPDDRARAAVPREGRHHYRWRQLAVYRHQPADQGSGARREFCLSAPASRAAKRARGSARRLCRAAIPRRGRM